MPLTDHSSTVIVTPDEELDVIIGALRAHGATAADALTQATMLVEGDLRGHSSHGIRRLPVLVARLADGATTSGIPAVLTWTASAALQVDGRGGMGPVVGRQAVDAIVQRATETGVAVAAVRNTGHLGMLAPYLERMTDAACVGIASTVSEALVHPWGGKEAMVGTNPIGIAVPTGSEPLILDMSTAATSAGKVLDHAARGQALPEGWAVDAGGQPTTDAAAAVAISPFGGAKGYALAVALEALVGVLSSTAFGRDVFGTLDTEHAPTKGDVFIAISVSAFGSKPEFEALDHYLDDLRASGTDGRETAVPGDRARTVRRSRMAHGVPLDRELWATAIRLNERPA